jgi:putative RNA 2'-phosphotransferase
MRRDDRRGGDRPRDSRRYGPGPRSADERLSRFLAYILRHHPEEVSLTLDERASADLNEVVQAVQSRPGLGDVTRERILDLVTQQGAQRFELLGDRLRARYGHSLSQPIQYEPAEPPPDLFHGTEPGAADTILQEGLKPAQRQYVHLSIDTPAAREVGQRRCPSPAVLRIDTECARKAGVRFYRAGPAVWLSDPIPPECIVREE